MSSAYLPGLESGSVSIRRMATSDLADVVRIELASYSMPWTEATFRGLIRRRDAELLVAEENGVVVGYSVEWFVVDQGELGNIAVDHDRRGRGIGRMLLMAAIAQARERDTRELFLEVRPSNTIARRLYEQFGFEQVGRRRNYYHSPREDALVMRLDLVPGTNDS